jgi:hypothetical protein
MAPVPAMVQSAQVPLMHWQIMLPLTQVEPETEHALPTAQLTEYAPPVISAIPAPALPAIAGGIGTGVPPDPR